MFRRAQPQTPEAVAQRVAELGWWYHRFQLPNGVWTTEGTSTAYDPNERWQFIEPYLPEDLSGKSVLDVGGNSGWFSLQMKLRGADRCVLVEPAVEFIEQAKFVFSQFAVSVETVNEDVHTYCLTTNDRFDYVLFLGLFYHLKYPVLVLDRLAEMTKERMFFNSHIQGPPAEGEEAADVVDREDLQADAFPRMAFIEGAYRGDLSNWWVPNYEALEPLARSAGLRVVARPHPEMLVVDPEPGRYLGKEEYRRLVFPRYGKVGAPVFPGAIQRKKYRQPGSANSDES